MKDRSDRQLSRRDALKLLGAAAGASVLANLPSKWTTPQLASGVLPAHAQASCMFDLQVEFAATEQVGAYLDLPYPDEGPSYPGGLGESGTWIWHCFTLETTCFLIALTYSEGAEGSALFKITSRDGGYHEFTASTQSGYPVATFNATTGSVTAGCGPQP